MQLGLQRITGNVLFAVKKLEKSMKTHQLNMDVKTVVMVATFG